MDKIVNVMHNVLAVTNYEIKNCHFARHVKISALVISNVFVAITVHVVKENNIKK